MLASKLAPQLVYLRTFLAWKRFQTTVKLTAMVHTAADVPVKPEIKREELRFINNEGHHGVSSASKKLDVVVVTQVWAANRAVDESLSLMSALNSGEVLVATAL